jgi:hypothetical protein
VVILVLVLLARAGPEVRCVGIMHRARSLRPRADPPTPGPQQYRAALDYQARYSPRRASIQGRAGVYAAAASIAAGR